MVVDFHQGATRLTVFRDMSEAMEIPECETPERRDGSRLDMAATQSPGEQMWQARMAALEERVVRLERELTETRVQASSDALTGVANRRSIEEAFTALRISGNRVVVALLDLDDFKAINDSFGHSMGDHVLVTTGKTLTHTVRPEDLVGRLGGDEFVVVLRDVTVGQAEHRLRHMLSLLSATPVVLHDQQAWFTASCGVTALAEGDTLSTLLRRADLALYRAKRSGKDCVVSQEHHLPLSPSEPLVAQKRA